MVASMPPETSAGRPSGETGRQRVAISGVSPEIDCGRFPIKRVVGEPVTVEADIFVDGHDLVSAVLRYRHEEDPSWSEVPLEPLGNDRWRGQFTVTRLGRYRYALRAWVDHFATWRRGLARKAEAGQDVAVDLLIGADLLEASADLATGDDAAALRAAAARLREERDPTQRVREALDPALEALVHRCPDTRFATDYDKGLSVVVDPERARFSTWYEMFPRSASPDPTRPGTLRDVEARLPYVAEMGFDILYLPPIHPIGRTKRKGRNNAPVAGPGDPGSPWAIGSSEGGHTAVHPELGTLDDLRRLVRAARELGIDVALDLAFQASPDHPYVREHPEWFRWRPDGTVQYAENPPKKYEDIYPFDFESEQWATLWEELARVVEFWIEQGVHVFRVDNPHTKPFAFWEWLIDRIKRAYPDVIFLSEAFTRPKVMYHLAKLGFSQSYTYFAWRATKQELIDYFTELTRSEVREYFRPNLWPNTPDILTEQLQHGGRPTFMARLVLAATLGASYGIYGPPFELMEHVPFAQGSEEYLDSEKYQVRHWDIDHPDSLREFIGRVNGIRRAHRALQTDRGLAFHRIDNDQIIAYSKVAPGDDDAIVTVVNLDPHYTQSGWLELPLDRFGLEPDQPFQVHDLLTDAYYLWRGAWNYVELDPRRVPAHILSLKRRRRTERDFEYFL
ncbi:MAG: alpha-1,4-glucan--maltose-1-phosphate maltosyltransferase [Sphaerobacter sp.]|nr:alpha-1,4-glucan--maltose-1-phosphate maltosyltransferase [Sphaerobacter sp.]